MQQQYVILFTSSGTKGTHYDDHSSIHTAVAAGQAPKAGIAETENCQQEGPTGPSDATTTTAPSDSRPGR